ncbi:copper resistance protein CopC [Hoyosella sp. YIM 151337]|uniref:copper resistance CopC/CopD family protein n=1 Tax=Hoyosella sp. YIM 151337 TaxID=2992742 RepID=UPI002236A8FB|nr:copper resistance protein CopC [Hoyosella sp. YIM 151337]MCW4354427.1 copper resistance protein CopC [Hoyosella sp. YIM 151337]
MQSRSRAVSGVVKAAAGVLLLTVAALLFAAPPAVAHAVLLGTDPGDGDILDSTPEIVTLTFNENITLPAEGVNVLDAAGAPVPSDARSVDATVQVTFDGDLDDGTYIVNWRVISADSHPVSGAFTFSVGAPSDTVADVAPPAAAPGTEALTVGTQAVVYLGGLTTAGLVFFHFLVTALTRGGVRIMRWSAVAAMLGMLAYVPAVYVWQNGLALSSVVTWDAVRDSFYAGGSFSAAALGAMLGIAGLAAAVTATSKGSGRAPAAVACGGAGLALGSLLLTGHTRTFGPPLVLLTSDAVHVTAAALWLGGVIGLVFVLRTAEGGAAAAVVRFSSIAALVLAASAVTGIVMAWLILDSLQGLTGTRYGLTLLLKVGAVAVVVLLAAWNRWKLVPIVGSEPGSLRQLRRIVGAEAVVLLVAASITAFLVSQSPTAVPRDETGQYSVEIGAATLDAHVSPLRVGTNALEFTLRDVDGNPIDAVSEPDLRVFMPDPGIGPLSPAVTQTGPGRYEAALDLPLPGEWEISVSARLSRFDNPVATLSVEVTE